MNVLYFLAASNYETVRRQLQHFATQKVKVLNIRVSLNSGLCMKYYLQFVLILRFIVLHFGAILIELKNVYNIMIVYRK